MKDLLNVLLAAGASLLLGATCCFAQTPAACTVTFFNSPNAGEVLLPQGINRFGTIVGFTNNPQSPQSGVHPFVRFADGSFGSCCKIPNVNPAIETASKRSASGVVVGSYQAKAFHGFVSSGAHTVAFNFPGAAATTVNGINRFGSIVGSRVPPAPRTEPSIGFVWKNGHFRDLRFGTNVTTPSSINDSGVVVGSHQVGANPHGFILTNGVFHDITVPGASNTIVNDINNAGVMVGTFNAGHGVQSFILKNGVLHDLVVPGARDVEVFGINGLNALTGFATFANPDGTVTTRALLAKCSL